MNRAKTTKTLFQDADYFGTSYDVPRGHAYFDRIAEASSRAEVEGYHDELTSIYA